MVGLAGGAEVKVIDWEINCVLAPARARTVPVAAPTSTIAVVMMSLREITRRFWCICMRIRETPSELMPSSNSPLRVRVGGSNVSENSNGPSSASSSNSHPFDQFEPRWLTEIDTSMSVPPQFSSDKESDPVGLICRVGSAVRRTHGFMMSVHRTSACPGAPGLLQYTRSG